MIFQSSGSKSFFKSFDSVFEVHMGMGKKLVSVEKKDRDKALGIVRKWIKKNPELTRKDYMKLWKAFIYSFWLADKRPVQQELAVNLAKLGQLIPDSR